MADEGESKLFPLTYFDGEYELNAGHVEVHSSIDYKTFQSILSEKIGISPNQMSIYLVDRKNSMVFHQNQRRILITSRESYNLIFRVTDCSILVVLKKSRRDRRRRSKLGNTESSYFAPKPENIVLLRRNTPDYLSHSVLPYYNHAPVPEYRDYVNQVRNLGVLDFPVAHDANMYNFPVIDDGYLAPENSFDYKFCDECLNEKMQDNPASFHPCPNDPVVVSFRSKAGPIAKPAGKFL